jgi:TonB family protein
LPPIWNTDRGGDPTVPQFVPEPFASIARKCLRVDPAARASLAELEAVLHPPAVQTPSAPEPKAAAPAAQRAPAPPPPSSPAPAPVAPEVAAAPKAEAPQPKPPQRAPSQPASQLPAFAFAAADPRTPGMQTAEGTVLRAKLSMPVIVGAMALLVVIIAALFMRSHKAKSESAHEVQESQTSTAPANPPAPEAAAQAPSQAVTPASAPAPAPPPPNPGGAANAKGAVTERVMPDVLPKASRSIRGKVTVRVRVKVDAGGAVSDASFDSAGPSRYFSNLAMQSSRKWRFEPARAGGNPAPGEWTLKYEFRRGKTDVTPVEVKP